MFEVVCTGENKYYGGKGEKRLLNDNYTLSAIKNGWIMDDIKYVGSCKTSTIPRVEVKEELMPIRRINVERTLEAQNQALNLIKERLNSIEKVEKDLLKLIGGKNK